jgi:hypothetical protein
MKRNCSYSATLRRHLREIWHAISWIIQSRKSQKQRYVTVRSDTRLQDVKLEFEESKPDSVYTEHCEECLQPFIRQEVDDKKQSLELLSLLFASYLASGSLLDGKYSSVVSYLEAHS